MCNGLAARLLVFPFGVLTNRVGWPFPFVKCWVTDPASGIMTELNIDNPLGLKSFPYGYPVEPHG